ncbi:Plasmodium exported protein, unknown function [Plasmodium gonderi]|uniref:Pv-fam-d protein n=1 Tax=Plasmodium gonderi TaxID=77519 RepID=A0A1Y1JP53_PLAGO|nr:Plasmodium exported protein, unknown function [Plasmodium gonderi]GAW83215.1 Plasmodium exported protein, unknown function [Plasmodium gonderi]
MIGKIKESSLTKIFTLTLLVWIYQCSNETFSCGKTWNKESNNNSTLCVRVARGLREDEEMLTEQRNAYLKEKLISIIEDVEEDDADDNVNFAKRFNSLIQEEKFQKGLNSLIKQENKKKQMNPYEYDDDFVKFHNSFIFNGNKNDNKNINLIDLEDYQKVQNNKNINKHPTKEPNLHANTSDFEKLHNSFNFKKQSTVEPNPFSTTRDFEKLHNSFNFKKQPTKETNPFVTTSNFEKQQNFINLKKSSAEPSNSQNTNDDFEKRYNALKDDYYSDKLFNGAYKNENNDLKEKTQHFNTFDGKKIMHKISKNDFDDLKKNERTNTQFDKMYSGLLKNTTFEAEKRVLKLVDDYPKDEVEKPLIDIAENTRTTSSEKKTNVVGNNPYTENRKNALSYAQNMHKLLNKLKYYNNVETAIDALKNDDRFKKILEELQQNNGMEKLLYILKYSDDSEEILSELKKSDNIEKLVYVFNYFENNSISHKKEVSKDNSNISSKLSSLSAKKKKTIMWLMKMLIKFDKMYEDQLLSIFSSDLDDEEMKDISEKKKILNYIQYSKILLPIAVAVILIAILSSFGTVTYYIFASLLTLSAIGYTGFKVKKCRYKKKVEKINKKKAQKSTKSE